MLFRYFHPSVQYFNLLPFLDCEKRRKLLAVNVDIKDSIEVEILFRV